MNQPTLKPTRKVTAGTTGGAAALLIVWGARQLGLDVPPEVAAAAVLLVSSAAAWWTRERSA